MNFLVKVHVLEAQLEQLLVELHALGNLFEVYDVLERDLEEANRFDERFGLEPLAEDGSGLTCELALLKAQVNDTGLQIHKLERGVALLVRIWRHLTTFLFLFLIRPV